MRGRVLSGAEALQSGRHVLAGDAAVQRRLHVRVHLEDDGELVGQRYDPAASGLISEALLANGVEGATPDAAVAGGRLVDRTIATRMRTGLIRSGLLQTVSDLLFLPCSMSLPRPIPQKRATDYAPHAQGVKHCSSFSTSRPRPEEDLLISTRLHQGLRKRCKEFARCRGARTVLQRGGGNPRLQLSGAPSLEQV